MAVSITVCNILDSIPNPGVSRSKQNSSISSNPQRHSIALLRFRITIVRYFHRLMLFDPTQQLLQSIQMWVKVLCRQCGEQTRHHVCRKNEGVSHIPSRLSKRFVNGLAFVPRPIWILFCKECGECLFAQSSTGRTHRHSGMWTHSLHRLPSCGAGHDIGYFYIR